MAPNWELVKTLSGTPPGSLPAWCSGPWGSEDRDQGGPCNHLCRPVWRVRASKLGDRRQVRDVGVEIRVSQKPRFRHIGLF